MNARRAAIGTFVAAALAAACQLIVGIDNHDFAYTPDAATVDSPPPPPDVAIPDPCAHIRPPPPGPNDDPTGDVGRLTFVIDHLDFAPQTDAGAPVGYDLDNVCTCDLDPGTAHDGGGSCVSPSPACDYEGGVDNALGKGISSLTIPQDQALQLISVDKQIGCGREGLMLEVTSYNGRANDGEVRVSPILGSGVFQPHDGGDPERMAEAGCGDYIEGGNIPPHFDESDLWSADPLSLLGSVGVQPVVATTAYVTDWQIVITDLPEGDILLGGALLKISTPIISARLTPLDLGADGKATRFTLEGGVFSGRIATRAMFEAMGQIQIPDKTSPTGRSYLCPDGGGLLGAALYQNIYSTLCPQRDVVTNRSADFGGIACDSLTAAARFTGKPATVYDRRPFMKPPPGCGGNFTAECP